jgi:hypothetical protein
MSDQNVCLDVDALNESYSPEMYEIKLDGKIYNIGQRNVILLGIVQSHWYDIANAGKNEKEIEQGTGKKVKIQSPEYYEQLRLSYTEMAIAILKEFNDIIDEAAIHAYCKWNINAIQNFVDWYNGEFQKRFLESGLGKAPTKKDQVIQDLV